MNEPEYQKMFEAEDQYWWFCARRELARTLLRRHGTGEPTHLLDLGCGTGAALSELKLDYPSAVCVGVDASSTALQFSLGRGHLDLILGSGTAIPVCSQQFDGALSLDTVEHIDDDQRVMEELLRALKPGGVAVISVPAYQWLWGPHDVALMHYRRYTARQFKQVASAAGFAIEQCSYSVFFLFPVVVAIRILDRISKRPNRVSLPKVSRAVNQALIRLMRFESALIARFALPWGSSVVAVVKRPK